MSPLQTFASTNDCDEEPEDISNGHDPSMETEDFLVYELFYINYLLF